MQSSMRGVSRAGRATMGWIALVKLFRMELQEDQIQVASAHNANRSSIMFLWADLD